MIYKTVLVAQKNTCCSQSSITDEIQKSLDQHSRGGWVLITAYQQKTASCNGPTVGAILIYGKRAR